MTNRSRVRAVVGVVACAAVVSACQSAADYAHSPEVAAQRATAARDIETVGESLSTLGSTVGWSTHDYCEEGQDNFKLTTTWRYQCRRISTVLIDPDALTVGQAVAELEVAVVEAGCDALRWAPHGPGNPEGQTVQAYTTNCPAVGLHVRGFIEPADAPQLKLASIPDEITVVDSPFSDDTVARFADASPLGWKITFARGYATQLR